ncbi:TniQ family protein [Krasilnikovia cinnamomea]|uniref:TniQ family protein n=1 Tax=Krasilnikovia cinnamomea TaxID=349313 RepID=UPI00102BBC12|nr:TniQ family protein [Krasilnikovia cinnamomea]
MTPRWPLHPAPVPGEALSSWLHRLARTYDMPVDELLRHNLGTLSADAGRDVVGLDLDPPGWLLTALAERTGVPIHQIARMAVSGWTPWLLDSLDHDPDAYTTYVRQDSVLLPLGEAPQLRPGR